jgi:glycosyltransferase involved in cell wall biosynthesis
VGRLSAEKGIDVLFEAARLLPEVQFGVAAGLEEARELVARAPTNVRFHGFLSGRELDDFYARSRLFACPSVWWEGFPNVVTRAMAHAKPVIASDLGVLSEIVEHQHTGLLFQAGNAAELASAIRDLWDDPGRCREMGDAGRKKAIREYCESVYYERLMTAYRVAESAT